MLHQVTIFLLTFLDRFFGNDPGGNVTEDTFYPGYFPVIVVIIVAVGLDVHK